MTVKFTFFSPSFHDRKEKVRKRFHSEELGLLKEFLPQEYQTLAAVDKNAEGRIECLASRGKRYCARFDF